LASTVYLPFNNSTLQCNIKRTANSATSSISDQQIVLASTTYSGIKLTKVG
jgi:hypothetical protein